MLRSIDLNRITDFIKIVELGNITRAAEALGERKAKLSRNLALLEKDLGVQLVHRTTRQFKLTEAGAQFYQDSKLNLHQIENSIQQIQKNDEQIEGKIRVTAPEDFGNFIITPLVSEFKKIHSNVNFDLNYTNEVLDLVKQEIDVAFRIGALSDSSLKHKKLARLENMIVASKEYLEKFPTPSIPEDLTHHQVIAFDDDSPTNFKLMNKSMHKKIKINPSFIANNFPAILNLTLYGNGISLLPVFLAEQYIKTGELIHILKEWTSTSSVVQIVIPNQMKTPNRIRKFFDYASNHLAGRI